MPKIDKNFEHFDDTKFSSTKEDDVLTEHRKDGSYAEYHKSKESRAYKETPADSYYTATKIYYANGNIREKGITFNANDVQLGIWYEFDNSGKIIKEIDYEKSFKFKFEDVLEFCRKEKIPVDKGPVLQSTGYHTTINKIENPQTAGAFWEIRWLKKPDLEEIIKLDGKTGEIISRKEQHFINN